MGSAGLSINLLTNILYRQAAALHPNLPLPAIAHPTPPYYYNLRPAALLLLRVHDPTDRPLLLQPTTNPGDTVTLTPQQQNTQAQAQHLRGSAHCKFPACLPFNVTTFRYLATCFFIFISRRRDRELTAWSRPLHITFRYCVPRQKFTNHTDHTDHLRRPLVVTYHCTVCVLPVVCVCVCLSSARYRRPWLACILKRLPFGCTGTPPPHLAHLEPFIGR